jgi:RNA polymerase sigma-70 factor (ECF subfamily)
MTDTPGLKLAAEQELIAQVRLGNSRCYDEIAGAYRVSLTSYCRALLMVKSDAEDVAQDVLSQAWVAIGKYRGDGPFKDWLFAIARNACLDRIRRHHPTGDVSEMETATDTRYGSVADTALSRIFAAQLVAEVKKVAYSRRPPWDEIDETMFLLYFHQGMKLPEIAQYLGMNYNTVRSRFDRKVMDVIRWIRKSSDEAGG